MREPLQRPQETQVGRPVQRPVATRVSDGVAREARLGIGLSHGGTAKEIHGRALAGAGTPYHDDMERREGLLIEEGPDAVTDQRRPEAPLTCQRRPPPRSATITPPPATAFVQRALK